MMQDSLVIQPQQHHEAQPLSGKSVRTHVASADLQKGDSLSRHSLSKHVLAKDSLTGDSVSIAPIPAVLLANDTTSIATPDTLPLFYKSQFVSTDSLELTEYHSAQEYLPGFEGAPLSYSPRTDDIIALTLFACFFLSSIALAKGKKFLTKQVKDFVLHRERTSIFDTSTAADVRYLIVLVVQTCVLVGITFFNYFQDTKPLLMEKVSPLLLLGGYVGCCLTYFLLKWLLYMFLGWVFFDKNKTNIWLESYSTLIYYGGFALFPYVLFLVYFDLSLTSLTVIGLAILIFTKILMFYKWVKLFFHQFDMLFLLILYFCALEIVPCLLLYQGMVEINNTLLIKF